MEVVCFLATRYLVCSRDGSVVRIYTHIGVDLVVGRAVQGGGRRRAEAGEDQDWVFRGNGEITWAESSLQGWDVWCVSLLLDQINRRPELRSFVPGAAFVADVEPGCTS